MGSHLKAFLHLSSPNALPFGRLHVCVHSYTHSLANQDLILHHSRSLAIPDHAPSLVGRLV